MGFDWKLYLVLADELMNSKATPKLKEAYHRTAISRSYYGVFCISKAFLIRQGVPIPTKDTHKAVREELKNSKNKLHRQIGSDLGRLWKKRKDADYEDQAVINNLVAKTSYLMAMNTLNNLQTVGAV